MKMQGNTIFITGGGTGIGRGLAEAFHREGNKVIICGRREQVLKKVCAENQGMEYVILDVAQPEQIAGVAKKVIERWPNLNCVINNAGVQRTYFFGKAPSKNGGNGNVQEQPFAPKTPDVKGNAQTDPFAAEINTNLLGLIHVCDAFLPHLQKQKDAVIVNVSSGLAFVPLAIFAVYCATKAAVHSFTMSLRHQIASSGVKVIELIPPYVDTDLGDVKPPEGAPKPMPLPDFIKEAMQGLRSGADEIPVGGAKQMREGAVGTDFENQFEMMNFRFQPQAKS